MSGASSARDLHVLALVHPVEDLAAAEAFLSGTLNLPATSRGEGWTALDNGSVFIRLVAARPGSAPTASRLVLELPSRDVAQTAAALLSQPAVAALAPASFVAADREEQWLAGPHGLTLCIARHYDEDELGVVPPLPSSLDWESDAQDVLKELLRAVPVSVRDLARARSTERAETLAVARGDVTVARLDALRGLVQATPAFMLEQLRRTLVERGIDPAPLEVDFEG